MTKLLCWLAASTILLSVTLCPASPLEQGFLQPPDSTKPSCYWYWISDNISKEGITRDLEAMKKVGIGEAFIGNIYLDDLKIGAVKALTEEWWSMIEHAIREGGRIGVKVGMFNCPGWSQSGGPWIKPSQAMRFVAITEQRVTGPANFSGKLEAPSKDFQDIALLAFPAPSAESRAAAPPKLSSSIPVENLATLVDGNTDAGIKLPLQPFHIDLEFEVPITARSLLLVPEHSNFSMQCELLAEQGGKFTKIREFPFDRSNNQVSVGFVPYAPLAISFPAVTAGKYRLLFHGMRQSPGLREVRISSEARIERYVEKQLGKMHPTPLPMWGDYTWPATTEPEADGLAVSPGSVRDLTGKLGPDGVLNWNVPDGDWVLLRCGMTPTGTRNAPASPEGQGLEVDKMNRKAAKAHFDAYIGKVISRIPKKDRKAFERVIADSYEMGSQNWTDGLRERFQERYDYDPQPWLPALTGRIVGSADESERFLWDLRRLVADQVAYDYVGGLRDACHEHGLKLWLENYGHWGFPAEFLQYGGQSDELGGEFWSSGNLGSIELRAAASAAHIYGKPRVSAEAFTSTAKFESLPWDLKRRGDWALTEGINHWVLHVYIHQPWEDKLPGVNAWFSTEFNRHNPWFLPGREFIDYYRRCQFLLQQGKHVADVAYFIGEDTPKMTGIQHPSLPDGYNYDYINAEVIISRLAVKDGTFVLPDGMSYKVLSLPPVETMTPELMEKIVALVKDGGIVLGNPPVRSPSLRNYSNADAKVKALAAELWSKCDGQKVKSARVGKGRVFRNMELKEVFSELGVPPQFRTDAKGVLWTRRSDRDGDIYFICNQGDATARIAAEFRTSGRAPELWDAASKRIIRPAVYSVDANLTKVPIELEARGSMFVVFRDKASGGVPISEIRRDGQVVLSATKSFSQESAPDDVPNNFTIVASVLPTGSIALPQQASAGVFISVARNELVTAMHGSSAFGPGHACAGISAGKNGVAVFEHSADYFAPLLSHSASLTNWTHLAVVYRDGKPSLYLNGKKAAEGLQSKHTVHSSLAADANSAGKFQGQVAGLKNYGRALSDQEIQKLASAPRDESLEGSLPSMVLKWDSGQQLLAEAAEPGNYILAFADGKERKLSIGRIPPLVAVEGPWKLIFPENRDVPRSLEMKTLTSLSEHENPAVRHFSGTVTYSCEFQGEPVTGNTLVWLDLGSVEGVAEVRLNDGPETVLWKPPFTTDVTTSFRPGTNKLQVRLSGTWQNRLIGDAKYPKGFPDGQGGVATLQFKPFLTANLGLKAQTPLSPFGLLGPVRLVHVNQVPVR